ncbi:MAG: PAS domain S-box protein, partial [Candidatus Thorarchaeota archaeon]
KRHVFCKFVPTTFDDGPKGATLIVSDETEKYLRQEQIAKSEERYRILVENIHDGMYILQKESIMFCNTALCDILQMTNEEIIGTNIWEFIHPEDLEWTTAEYYKRLAGIEGSNEFVVRLIRKNGEVILVSSRTSIIDYNGDTAILGIIRDITNQTNLRTLLIKSHEIMLDILDPLEIPIYVVDSNTYEVVFANQKVIELMGNVLGKMCWKVFHENSEGPCSACVRTKEANLTQEEKFSDIEGCSEEYSTMGGNSYRFFTKRILWKDFRLCRITVGYEN